MKLAIVGTRGIPNNYGGFETVAEYLVEYLAKDISITVYCSSKDMDSRLKEYKGAKLKYVPISSHGAKGIIYDSISLIHSISRNDKILLFAFGGGFVMPFLSKKSKSKIIINIGGLDWKRSKWSKFSQKVIKLAESLLIKNSGKIIADNIGIQEYISQEYKKESVLITYGGDQVNKQSISGTSLQNYPFLKDKYAFTVTRIQPDNNIDMILEAFCRQENMPLVIVGNWGNSVYGKTTRIKYSKKNNLILLDAIYDREKLDILRSNCTIYIHGHSAGGTNPALVEAMYLGLPVFAFASGYNEHTTKYKALYFQDSEQLMNLINSYASLNLNDIGFRLKEVAEMVYRWGIITKMYQQLIFG